ncbi:MAG: ferredoxin family protein [Verrucomicrobia subdivision 3 bacterium]|nr:ferredoxin family protein [Limisphaerales bacterium]
MAIRDQIALQVVLYEGAGAQELSAPERFALMAALLEKGYSIRRCSSEEREGLDDPNALLLGRFTNGHPGRKHAIDEFDVNRICEAVESARAQSQALKHGEWKPWFPVIDYDRCTNCMQCLSFCLFGVYGVDGQQRIQVQNNDNCKTNCPACSRVCPEAAIMFPKYKAGPINGDVVSDADLQREKMKVDISALLGGDVYQLLRERSERAKSRFSKERDADKALKERQKCLVKLAQGGDIPPEVLMSLPSPDEIQRRAAEAKAKAEAALAAIDGQS